MLTKLFAALLTVLLLTGSIPTQTPNAKSATPELDTPSAKKALLQIEKTTPPVTEPEKKTLTAAQAEDIALQNAGLTREVVTFSRTEKDIERSGTEWEIEFRHGDWEYDYTIHAETGKILEWDKEYDPKKPAPVAPPVTEPPVTKPPVTEPAVKELTAADAKAIALAHAGLTESQVTRLKAEKDRDDGIWVYEIEFRSGRMEYEYEIHAENGKILDWDKELDD